MQWEQAKVAEKAGPSWTASRSPAGLLYASKVQRKAESQGVGWRLAGDADLSATGRRLLDAVDAAGAGDDAETSCVAAERAAHRYRAQEDPAGMNPIYPHPQVT